MIGTWNNNDGIDIDFVEETNVDNIREYVTEKYTNLSFVRYVEQIEGTELYRGCGINLDNNEKYDDECFLAWENGKIFYNYEGKENVEVQIISFEEYKKIVCRFIKCRFNLKFAGELMYILFDEEEKKEYDTIDKIHAKVKEVMNIKNDILDVISDPEENRIVIITKRS